ncbi:MAG TPA: hypothetical protein VM076_26120 [Gemmatimonadaceae bacterium]|nr:hypothetical protein [Gemmatimonadaceae bacterium]
MDAAVEPGSADVGVPIRAAVILGNDAILAAKPYTTAQLTHACGAAGFDIVVPPSWGDELVARAYLERLAERTEHVVVACACERVRALVPQALNDSTACVAVAAPPVAAARYLRAVHSDSLLVTFVGDCPSASDPSIDARFSAAGFLASLHRQGISLDAQPNEPSVVEAERWRRFESTPGGFPALRFLGRAPVNRVLRETESVDAGRTATGGRSKVLMDMTSLAGCACAADGARLVDLEPTRATTPIVVGPRGLDLSAARSPTRGRHTLRARKEPVAEPVVPPVPPPAPNARPTTAAPTPVVLRSGLTPATPALATVSLSRVESQATSRLAFLIALPLIILGAATALGIGVYRTAASPYPTREAPDTSALRARPGDPIRPTVSASGELDSVNVADSSRRSATSATATTAGRDSVRPTRATGTDSAAVADSVARARRVRRSRAPQVIPGWMPQGRRRFTPVDTSAIRRDSVPTQPRAGSLRSPAPGA